MESEQQDNNDNIDDYISTPGNLMDSKASQLDDALHEKLDDAFQQETSHIVLHDVSQIACEHDPIDLAYAVTRLPASARIVVYDNLPDLNAKITFMVNTGSSTRAAIFKQMDDGEIKELTEKMPPDEAVWVLDDMSDRRIRRVLELLPPKKAAQIKELQKHERYSAGRIMTNEFFAFPINTTVSQVAEVVLNNPGIELMRSVFIEDENRKLVGSVTARSLIVNPPYVRMGNLMRPILHKVTVDTSRDEVVDIVERYKLSELPVVDENDKLIGLINYEDVVEALEDIADETIASMAGTAEDVSEHEPIFKRFMWRAPWLLVTLFAGLVTATAMTHFNDRIWFVVVPFFVPLINMMSGNVGLQCSTMLVRAMSTGELSSGSRVDALMKELGIGLMIGLVFGILCGSAVYCMKLMGFYHMNVDPLVLGATVSCGLLGACMTATTLGTFSPFFFAKFGIDPAVASGPIVTSFNDVLSTLIFFMIAWGVHSLLIA